MYLNWNRGRSTIPLMHSRVSPFNREFLLLVISAGLATVWDIDSTLQAQRDPDAAEVNSWIYGERPSRLRMYAINIPLTLGFAHVSYRLRQRYSHTPHHWLWRVPLVALSVGHVAAAVANRLNFP